MDSQQHERRVDEFMGRVDEALRALSERQQRVEATLNMLLAVCRERGEKCAARFSTAESAIAQTKVLERLILPALTAVIAAAVTFWAAN